MTKKPSDWELERERLVSVLQLVLSTDELRNEWAYELAEIDEACKKVTLELIPALVRSSGVLEEIVDQIAELAEETEHLAYHLGEFRKKYDGPR